MAEQTFVSGVLYGYDNRSRTTSVTQKKSDNSTISAESYQYDAASNLTQKTVDNVITSYAYDEIDQLLSEGKSGYSGSYTYDGNGNRLTKTLGGTTETYSYSDSDELVDIKVGGTTVKSFGYDAAGRTTSITYSGVTTTLAYDYESRITQISRSGVTTNTFTYNGLDTRVGKVDSGGTKTYKRDGAYVTDPVLSDGAANYTPGISEKRSGTTKYNNGDYLGSFTRQTDSSQATSGTRSYDAFGVPTGTTGSPTSPFGFGGGWGYQEDGDYGLKLLGHRYCDPSTGRFLTRDPAMSGRNWFAYCGNNPTRFVDAAGLWYGQVDLSFGVGMIWLGGYFSGGIAVDHTGDVYVTGSIFAGYGLGVGLSTGVGGTIGGPGVPSEEWNEGRAVWGFLASGPSVSGVVGVDDSGGSMGRGWGGFGYGGGVYGGWTGGQAKRVGGFRDLIQLVAKVNRVVEGINDGWNRFWGDFFPKGEHSPDYYKRGNGPEWKRIPTSSGPVWE